MLRTTRSQKLLLTAAITLGFAASLSGCAESGQAENTPATSGAPTTAQTQPTTTPTAAPAQPGTRDNPIPAGTPGQWDPASMWTWIVGQTDTDGWPEIQAANQFNSPPAEGSTFLLLPVSVTASTTAATNGADPMASVVIEYVTAGGRSYDGRDCGVLPSPGALYNVGTMYPGATADFVACAQVPIQDSLGGAWKFSSTVARASVFFQGP